MTHRFNTFLTFIQARGASSAYQIKKPQNQNKNLRLVYGKGVNQLHLILKGSTMTIASSIVETVNNSFNFNVDKLPLSGPDNLRTPFYGLFRSDSGEVVSDRSVSNRYVPHQTDDILALVESAGHAFEDGIADVRCHFNQGHYVSVQPTREYREAIFGESDNVFPRITISAGYDGKSFKAWMGFYRDLCRNMSMLSMVNGTSVSIRHTSGLRAKMNDLIETFSVLKNSWATLTDVIHNMEATQVNLKNFLKDMYGDPSDSKRGRTMHENRTEAIMRRVVRERLNSGRPDLQTDWMVSAWEAYNAVQGYVQHDAIRHGSMTELGRIVKASHDPSVKRAESLLLAQLAA